MNIFRDKYYLKDEQYFDKLPFDFLGRDYQFSYELKFVDA